MLDNGDLEEVDKIKYSMLVVEEIRTRVSLAIPSVIVA